jgi:hypothetical protein
MLHFVCSTPILGTTLQHNDVLFFRCLHNKIMFEPMSCTFHVHVLGFHVLCLDLKLGLFFCYDLLMFSENLCLGYFCANDTR